MPPERMSYEDYLALIRRLDTLIGTLQTHPDAEVRQQTAALLEGIDTLHREGLRRLVARLGERENGAGPDGMARDPVVHTLLGLYDLAALDLPAEPRAGFVPEEAVKGRRRSDPGAAGGSTGGGR